MNTGNAVIAGNTAKAYDHIWFQHSGADGFITIAKKQPNGKMKQYHYKPEELAANLSSWMGEDVFFSQNTFYRPQRSIENIRELRSIYVDVDFYIFNYDPRWIMGKLETEYFGEALPTPNIVIFSGQGIVLIWLIDPVPYKALPLWQAVENYFVNILKGIGGDTKASDAARVFRVAGSINSKNGNDVKVQYNHAYRYELRQLQTDYLPELTPYVNNTAKKTKGRKKKVIQLYTILTLHFARLKDITKLVELRNHDIEGHRETICFLYRYWLCCYTNDPAQALEDTLELNSSFMNPLPNKEVMRATKSAEKAWEAKSNKKANEVAVQKGYPGAGYNISNYKLIDWLDIQPDEMIHMLTIIDTKEKRRRDKKRKEEKRRENGAMTRANYLGLKDIKVEKLETEIKKNPKISIRKLAEITGIPRSTVQRLKKEIQIG